MKRYYEGEVSIFKREGSPYWTAYYRDGAGRQRKKSLKTKNLKAAQKRAREINVLLESGDEGRLDALRRHRTVMRGPQYLAQLGCEYFGLYKVFRT